MHLREFINAGGVFLGSNSSAEFAVSNNFTYGLNVNRPGSSSRVVGSLLRTKIVDATSPVVYGVPDNLAMYSDAGDSFSVSANVGGGGRAAAAAGAGGTTRGGRGGGAGARPTGRERRMTRMLFRDDQPTRDRTCRRCRLPNKYSRGSMPCQRKNS
jgi:hypothetical protein